MKTLQLLAFENKKTGKLWLFNLETNGAIFIRAGTTFYDLSQLGFKRITVEEKLLKKIVKNVRAGNYDPKTDLNELINIYHPEDLL